MTGNDDNDEGGRPPYSDYLTQIYSDRMLFNTGTPLTTDPNQWQAEAKKVMSLNGYNYVAGGANEGATMDANRLAFRQWKFIPRMLKPAFPTDMSVELFGEKYETPIIVAPVGVQELYHPEKEVGTARAAAALRVPFTISTSSTSSIEEITDASPGPTWFQLYWPADDDITISLLRRVARAGCKVLVVTLDTFAIGWRPADLDTGFIPFPAGQGNAVGFSDPVFRRKFAAQSDGETPESDVLGASRYWLAEAFPRVAHRWEELALLRREWKGPIVLKGIQCIEDARLALDHGMDGIVVSNHGGRQIDGAVGSLEMLPEIVDAVGAQMTVLFDSGVRTGMDIAKALCLGARAVLVGRPVMYGLGIAGEKGAKHVMQCLLADLEQSMNLGGVKSISDLGRDRLRKVAYGGDLKASL